MQWKFQPSGKKTYLDLDHIGGKDALQDELCNTIPCLDWTGGLEGESAVSYFCAANRFWLGRELTLIVNI